MKSLEPWLGEFLETEPRGGSRSLQSSVKFSLEKSLHPGKFSSRPRFLAIPHTMLTDRPDVDQCHVPVVFELIIRSFCLLISNFSLRVPMQFVPPQAATTNRRQHFAPYGSRISIDRQCRFYGLPESVPGLRYIGGYCG